MAKRRNKNKVKRRLAGYVGRDGFGLKENSVKVLSGNSDEERSTDPGYVLSELTEQVQVTETDTVCGEVTEKFGDDNSTEELVKSDGLKLKITKSDTMRPDKLKSPSDDAQINPREIDGETCLDIECGANEAVLVLSKLWLGSKGACIKFMDKWLTPNEFQAISGRESAKDWKRSIRHNAKSLKVLITKGLIDMRAVPAGRKSKKKSPTKSPAKDTFEMFDENTPETENAVTDELDDTLTTADDEVSEDKSLQESNGVNSADDSNHISADDGDAADMKENRKVTVEPVNGKIVGKHEPDGQQPKKRGRKPKRQRLRHQLILARAARKMVIAAGERANKRIDAVDVTPAEHDVIEKPEESAPEEEPKEELTPESDTKAVVVSDVTDTRSDEERRLDGFLQTLRLTKATGPRVTKTDPDLPVINLPVGKGEPLDDTDDVEMPVLEKVSDLSPVTVTANNTETAEPPAQTPQSAVDGLHSTVTPPPTPPGEKVPIEQKLVGTSDENVIATFKSRLSPTGDGLKLTINREKVKTKLEEEDDEERRSFIPAPKEQQNMQTFLLQDALQSAKKYKEKLQQSKQNCTSTSSPVIHVPKVSNDYLARSREMFTDRRSTQMSVSKQAASQEYTNRAMHMKHAFGQVTTTSSVHHHKSVIDTHMSVGKPSVKLDKLHDHRLHTSPKHGTVPVSNDTVNKAFMSNMASLYGPQYYPSIEKKDSIMMAMQDAYRKDDVLRQFPTGALPGTDASPLLYPMMTQQILLAMTQQLYSMCNVPATSSVGGAFVPPQDLKTSLGGVKTLKPNELDYLSRCSNVNSAIHTSKPFDLSSKKRRHTTVDENGALDLSVKRTKYDEDMFDPYGKVNSSVHKHVDIPLDFSSKSHSLTDVRNSRAALSFPSYLHYAQSAKTHDKHYVPSCYRVSPPVDTKSKTSDSSSFGPWSSSLNGFSKSQALPACTCDRKNVDDITTWGVEQVCDFLKTLDGCGIYSKTFQEQGISGQILPVLTTQHLTRTLGMKVGPALTLMHAVERKFREKLLAPSCGHCTRRLTSAVHI